MQRAFVVVLVGAGVFVWLTSADLPPIVASHFDARGVADGFTNKGTYTVLVLSLVVGIPALLGFSALWLRRLPPQLINVPNRQYWLAPERRAASLEALSSMFLALAFVVVFFMCFVHWLVVGANAMQPAALAEAPLFAALGLFAGAMLVWLVVLYRRFGRVPVARIER